MDSFTHNGCKVTITRDQDADSPDAWGDDGIFLVAFHRQFHVIRADLKKPDDIEGWEEAYHVIPVNAYIHSGVSLSLAKAYPFNCPFDGGRVGYVLVSKAEWETSETAVEAAQALVDTWNQYLNGDVWCYTVEGPDGKVEACGGFYGQQDAITDAKAVADYLNNQFPLFRTEHVTERVTYGGTLEL